MITFLTGKKDTNARLRRLRKIRDDEQSGESAKVLKVDEHLILFAKFYFVLYTVTVECS